MGFRPCIDLHAGKVKQIVGSSLVSTSTSSSPHPTFSDNENRDRITNDTDKDSGGSREKGRKKKEDHDQDGDTRLQTNFESEKDASEFAQLYQEHNLSGGHIIMLGPGCREQCLLALSTYPGGLQVGGGITPLNCMDYLEAGASHIIVTSYIFVNGQVDFSRLEELVQLVGKEKLVIDLSCRKRHRECQSREGDEGEGYKSDHDPYIVVIDKWQTFTDYEVNEESLKRLAEFCSEFLVHGVDVEGKQCGILEDLVELLGKWSPLPVTYAGGARSIQDLELVNKLGQGKVHITVGSALDIFGGDLPYEEVVAWHQNLLKERI